MIIGINSILKASESQQGRPIKIRNRSATQVFTGVELVFDFGTHFEFFDDPGNRPPVGTFDIPSSTWKIGTMQPGIEYEWDVQVKVLSTANPPLTFTGEATADQFPDQLPGNDDFTREFVPLISCEDLEKCDSFAENHGNVLYVATTGDNATAERGLEHKPWRDPWAAAQRAQDGDVIYVYPGVYTISDPGDGGDKEYVPGDPNSFTLVPPTVQYIRFFFENGVEIRSTVRATGEPSPPTLFQDNNQATTVFIQGYLFFNVQQKGVRLTNFPNIGSTITLVMEAVFGGDVDQIPDSPPALLGETGADYVDIRIREVFGVYSRMISIRPESPTHRAIVEITRISAEDPNRDLGTDALYTVDGQDLGCSGNTDINSKEIRIKVDNTLSANGRGQGSVLNFRRMGGTTDEYQFRLVVDNYNDNIEITDQLDTGLQDNIPILQLGNFPDKLRRSNISVHMHNITTGANFCDFNSAHDEMISSSVSLTLGHVVLTSINVLMRIGAPHRIQTLTDSLIGLNLGLVVRSGAGNVLVPILAFNAAGNLTRNRSKCIITGNLHNRGAGNPVIKWNNTTETDTYLFKDCTFITEDALSPEMTSDTANTEAVIQNCSSNARASGPNIVERGMPIVRDEAYG